LGGDTTGDRGIADVECPLAPVPGDAGKDGPSMDLIPGLERGLVRVIGVAVDMTRPCSPAPEQIADAELCSSASQEVVDSMSAKENTESDESIVSVPISDSDAMLVPDTFRAAGWRCDFVS
jgi:hypothetical protein